MKGRPRVRGGRAVNIQDWEKQSEVLSNWNNGMMVSKLVSTKDHTRSRLILHGWCVVGCWFRDGGVNFAIVTLSDLCLWKMNW